MKGFKGFQKGHPNYHCAKIKNILCKECNKNFVVNINSDRIFCCKKCYTKNQIGEPFCRKAIDKSIEIRKGKHLSIQTKSKISLANSAENNGMFNKKHNDLVKLKISNQSKSNWKNPEIRNKIMSHPNRKIGCRKGALVASQKIRGSKYFTQPEKIMCSILSKLGYKYIHHYSVLDIKHLYVADFFLINDKTIIEVDGTFWHNYPIGRPIDLQRNKELKEKGYKIIRFWENELDENLIQNVLNKCEIKK